MDVKTKQMTLQHSIPNF